MPRLQSYEFKATYFIQPFHDFIHKNFGLIPYRQAIQVRKDAFFQLIPSEDSAQDNQLMKRLSNTIETLTKQCFDECVEPTQSSVYLRQEKSCVKRCVQQYFQGYKSVVKWTNKEVSKSQAKETND